MADSGRPPSTATTYAIVDPQTFLKDGLFRQDDFLAAITEFDWTVYSERRVLVRGCGSTPIPPWAYMAITARLVGIAGSIRYGNEHDNVVVWRAKKGLE